VIERSDLACSVHAGPDCEGGLRTRTTTIIHRGLRTFGRLVAPLFSNEDVRHLLWPSEAIESRKGAISMHPTSYFNGGPRVHSYNDDDGVIDIGKYCSIANDVEFFLGGNHHPEWISTYPHHAERHEVTSKGDIEIGHNVWIGRGAAILSGVHIGHGAIVGAKSLVTRDVRPYSVVGGVPAQEIRRRYDERTIRRLLEIAWWDWPKHVVEAHADVLQSSDIEAFLEQAESVARAWAPTVRRMTAHHS
jgi:acetyltransferase-like isoleucine patch superfamily enzyme